MVFCSCFPGGNELALLLLTVHDIIIPLLPFVCFAVLCFLLYTPIIFLIHPWMLCSDFHTWGYPVGGGGGGGGGVAVVVVVVIAVSIAACDSQHSAVVWQVREDVALEMVMEDDLAKRESLRTVSVGQKASRWAHARAVMKTMVGG